MANMDGEKPAAPGAVPPPASPVPTPAPEPPRTTVVPAPRPPAGSAARPTAGAQGGAAAPADTVIAPTVRRSGPPLPRQAPPRPAPRSLVPTGVRPAGKATPAVLPAASAVAPGQPFGRYTLVKELGRGGMGVVYKAYHPGLKSYFAIKVLLAGSDASVRDIQRFRREAQAAARLKHPGILAVHDVGVEGERTYIVMEYVQGASLDKVLQNPPDFGIALAPGLRQPWVRPAGEGPAWGINPSMAAQMTKDIAEALQSAHEAGVIHRDLKPANVLRDTSGRLKVLDFGLAKLVDAADQSGATRTGAIMGTPAYMSPEQAEGRVKEIDARSDVYQIGAIFYELLTGRPPYWGDSSMDILLKVMQQDPSPPRGWNPHIPRDAETICLKCLERNRRRRYASAADLAADLGRLLAGDPIVARPISAAGRVVRKVVKYRRFLLPLAAAFLLAAGFGVYALVARGHAAASQAQTRQADLGRDQAQEAQKKADHEKEMDKILARAEALWREAKAVLSAPGVPLERYHEKLAEAMKVYEQAIGTDSTYGWIYESRGRIKIQTSDLAGAEGDLTKAIELLGPERGKAARRSLGRVYLERSINVRYESNAEKGPDRVRAAELLTLSLNELNAASECREWRGTSDEGEAALRLATGLQAWGAGDRARAVQLLQEGVERNSNEECAWALAIVAPEARSDHLESALRICPRHARALLDRSDVRSASGDRDGAIADCTEAILIDPKFVTAYMRRGYARMVGSHREDGARESAIASAIADFDAAIRIDPRCVNAYLARGNRREEKGDLAGALADYDEAIRINPNGASAYIDRGSLRRRMGDLSRAIAEYDEAIRIDPKLSAAYSGRAAAYAAKGDLDRASADYDESIRVDPTRPWAYLTRGNARKLKGDLDGAIADFQKALEASPADVAARIPFGMNLAHAYGDRGDARVKKGDTDGAIADYQAALQVAPLTDGMTLDKVANALEELEPRHSETYLKRGAALARKGDPDGARAEYQKALDLAPPAAPIRKYIDLALVKLVDDYFRRGQVLESKGDQPGAIAEYRKGVEIAPANSPQRAKVQRALDVLDPNGPGGYFARGDARRSKRDLDGAIADYLTGLDLARQGGIDQREVAAALQRFSVDCLTRGRARMFKGDLDGANADAHSLLQAAQKGAVRKMALDFAFEVSRAFFDRGDVRRRKGDLDEANADYQKALEASPPDSPLRDWVVGQFHAREGKH